MSLEVYLEPSQTSTMKLFRENSYRLFPLKSLIVDLRLDSEFASETVILLKKKNQTRKIMFTSENYHGTEKICQTFYNFYSWHNTTE